MFFARPVTPSTERTTTFTLRCTAKLLKRLKLPADTSPRPPTTQLGDWTAHLLFTRRVQIVLCVAEQTLLPILLPGRDMVTLSRRILGSLNDFVRLAEPFLVGGTSLLDLALRLPDAPCSPIAMESPRRATLRAFHAAE